MADVLGRGLGALMPDDNTEEKPPEDGWKARVPFRGANERPKESVFWIETEKIVPNPDQPRKHFDEEGIRQLADSIRQYGILQPIVVTKIERDVPTGTQVEYQLIAGERRYRAAKLLNLAHMPAVIRREEMSAETRLELALIENLQREDLNPIDRAKAYQRLIEEFKMPQTEVSKRLGKSREAIANTMRLLNLPDRMQEMIIEGRVGEGHLRPLLALGKDTPEQQAMFERIFKEHLTSRQVEDAVRALKERKIAVEEGKLDPFIREYEEKIGSALGTRVEVRRGKEGRGEISIHYFSEEELRAIAQKLAEMRSEAYTAAAMTVPDVSPHAMDVNAAPVPSAAATPADVPQSEKTQEPPFTV